MTCQGSLAVRVALGCAAIAVLIGLPAALVAQRDLAAAAADPRNSRTELARAKRAADEAGQRALQLAEEAETATEAFARTQAQAAALAARIQQAEADITEAEVRLALIGDLQLELNARLAQRQQPLVRLSAALQNMARRPLALSALKPGSLKDTVYLRAVLATTVPEIRERTADLRDDLDRSKALAAEAKSTLAKLRDGEGLLNEKRRELAALEVRQRIASREANSIARREQERALVLAEEARDLDDLVGELDRVGALRRELAALPGPILRPQQPGAARVVKTADRRSSRTSSSPPADLRLPVEGRTLAGFGETGDSGLRSRGLTLAPRGGAQVVASAAGRVAFSGPYRGFGRIVIIEHANGWTSVITGLERSNVATGTELVAGSPIGAAASVNAAITLELRRDGKPVNPLEYI
ncbi:peptidoglycan DD-metalloendopeptidase family protein [Erythrobacteraceae bacterium E2-1 Yellow Sea]|nr:peptidoglycan DD-metalloendopeptidase family protein [Erythrobacteraceae bacterium E2-1 Yellow Sea]